ncbi:MAG: bifunctional biotin--[acetyl-CoA-carboxylase] ligase/biotin operon repressor BirA [Gammaproteobacteria bacterium]|nr:bifunctional biotin--[acetyl-CoA-carboxylase] ligase/biotin operon repressor BirA [Gammaproteobacteria bacterium]
MKALKLNNHLVALVHLLNDGQFHDGTTMGRELKMTRSAVWKLIKKLQHYGVSVQSLKGRGYALAEPLQLLNKKIIKKNISEKVDIEIFETLDSTNNYLRNFFNHTSPKICLAEVQTAGKGRLHRHWHSPFGENIYFSCLYPFKRDLSEMAGLSLVVSLAIVESLKFLHLPYANQVKWPNDILYEGRKLAGILIELQAEAHGACHVIIGIGLNVNMSEKEGQCIEQPWTSLKAITGQYIDRNLLAARLITQLFAHLKHFEQIGFTDFMPAWHAVDYLRNKDVTLNYMHQTIKGHVKGIDKQGHLIMESVDGTLQTYSAGDTSLIKTTYA